MRISREEIQKINKIITERENKKHLHENKDQREIRRANDYCKKYNSKNNANIINGVKGAIYKNSPKRYVKNEKGEWELENIIFKYRNKHAWENHNSKHLKSVSEETCILYQNNNFIIVNAIIEKHYVEYYDIYTQDEKQEFITMKLPQYDMKFTVEKKNDFKDIPDYIYMKGEKFSTTDLFKAILQKAINIYEVK